MPELLKRHKFAFHALLSGRNAAMSAAATATTENFTNSSRTIYIAWRNISFQFYWFLRSSCCHLKRTHHRHHQQLPTSTIIKPTAVARVSWHEHTRAASTCAWLHLIFESNLTCINFNLNEKKEANHWLINPVWDVFSIWGVFSSRANKISNTHLWLK